MTLIKALRWVLLEEAGAAAGGGGGSATVLGLESATATQGAGGVADASGLGVEAGAAAGVETGAIASDGPAATATAESGQQALEYADFSVPEGMQLNPDLLGEFKGLAQGMGLKQEQAQQLTDLGVKLTQGLLRQQAQALETQKTAWKAEVLADAEIGGEKFDAAMAQAARAVKQFVPDALKVVFDQTGIGNHPALVKAFVQIGALLQEDGVVTGAAQLSGARDARAMYPNSPGLR
jgi:hypothetical protein